ncbi:MAG: VanZ family protein [Pseudomonadota bacterium]
MQAARIVGRGAVTAMYAGLIFALSSSSQPLGLDPPDIPGLDKLVHGLEFGVLALLLRWSLAGVPVGWTGRTRDLLAVVLAALYGVSDELHQRLVPGRDASPWDSLADAIGAIVLIAVVASQRPWQDTAPPGGDRHAA